MKWFIDNIFSIISFGVTLIGFIITLVKVYDKINNKIIKNEEDIKDLQEGLKEEKSKNKDNYNKLHTEYENGFSALLKRIDESNAELRGRLDKIDEMNTVVNELRLGQDRHDTSFSKQEATLDKLANEFNMLKTDVEVVKNDILYVKQTVEETKTDMKTFQEKQDKLHQNYK